MAEVILQNVGKVYAGGVRAVCDFNLNIRDQEFIVLVGPSGCGKSTTLRMVAGLEEISEGTIAIGDRVVNDVPPKDRDIAMVFQNYALYPHMTVYKNMAFGLKLRKFPKKEIDERVRWAAGILGLSELLDRKPKALSGGQRQRVAVGRAIVRHPKAFLFDEPLSNLDAKLRVETRAELKRLHKRLQTTTIYVTHDQEEAMTLGDRVVVMDGGYIQQSDTPLTVYSRPVNRFVAGFLGTPPMNFLDGRLLREGGRTVFVECRVTDRGQPKTGPTIGAEVPGGVRLALSPEQARNVQAFVGRQVVVGIRPEGLHLHPMAGGAAADQQQIVVKVAVVEPLGSSMDIHGTTAGDVPLVARVAAESRYAQAEQVKLFLDLERVHVFEPGIYGRNLTMGAAPEA